MECRSPTRIRELAPDALPTAPSGLGLLIRQTAPLPTLPLMRPEPTDAHLKPRPPAGTPSTLSRLRTALKRTTESAWNITPRTILSTTAWSPTMGQGLERGAEMP